jgi:hypothetical protein
MSDRAHGCDPSFTPLAEPNSLTRPIRRASSPRSVRVSGTSRPPRALDLVFRNVRRVYARLPHLRDRLDRLVGAQLLRYATRGELPNEQSIERQAAALGALKRLLELDGYGCESVAATKNGPVPLMVQRDGQRVAVGVKSSLLDATWNDHSLQRMDVRGGPAPAILNDYILRRNPPDEHQLIRKLFERAH